MSYLLSWHQLAGSALVGGITSSLLRIALCSWVSRLCPSFSLSGACSVCGVVTVQTSLYYSRFPNDPRLLRYAVRTLIHGARDPHCTHSSFSVYYGSYRLPRYGEPKHLRLHRIYTNSPNRTVFFPWCRCEYAQLLPSHAFPILYTTHWNA